MRRSLLICVAAAALVSSVPAQAAGTRTETKSYVLANDTLLTDCELLGTEIGINGACFDLDGFERTATVRIEDLHGMPVGGAYGWSNAVGTSMGIGLFCEESAALAVPEGATQLRIYANGPAFGAVNCILERSTGAGTTGTIAVTYALGDDAFPPATDGERECLEPAPAAIGISGVTDDGSDVNVAVRVLLDGLSEEYGRETFEIAARSYAPLGITLDAVSFEQVTFTEIDAQELINRSKAHVGGERPAGIDLVFLLTSKDITAINQPAVAGLADCIGGIRFPERSFAVGERIAFEDTVIGPLTFYRDATARAVAHEIGHLFGGQHHYANCVEDADGDVVNGELTPCSLMFNSLDAMGPDFDTLNGAVVRGHAVEYA
jgi:hypothetical protein